MNRTTGYRRGRLDEGEGPARAIDEPAQADELIVQKFDPFLGRAIFSIREYKKSVDLETVCVFRNALDRHPESLGNRPEPRVAGRRDFEEE